MVANKNSAIGRLGVLVVIRLIITYLPAVNVNCPEIIKLITIVGVYALLFFYDRRFFFNIWFLLPVFIIDIYSFTISYLYPFHNNALLSSLYSFMRPLSWALIGYYYLYNADNKNARRILSWFTLLYVITAITTCIGCSVFPNAARLMATGMDEEQDTFNIYMNYNIGSFSFVYSALVMTPLIICVYRERLINRFVSISLLILVFITILYTEYTTALIFFASCLILLITPKDYSIKKTLFLLFVIVIMMVLLRPVFAKFLYFISSLLSSEQMAVRFEDLANSFAGVQYFDSADLDSRFERWESSWRSFLASPLVGGEISSGVGGHSFVLDKLALYGLIGLAGELIYFVSLYRKFVLIGKSTFLFKYCVYCLFLQFACACVNPHVFYEPFTLVMPLFFVAFAGNKNVV